MGGRGEQLREEGGGLARKNGAKCASVHHTGAQPPACLLQTELLVAAKDREVSPPVCIQPRLCPGVLAH